MSEGAIDQAILSTLSAPQGRSQKVAMVIAKVVTEVGGDLPDGDEGYERVARRIEVLVSEGRLVGQGNIKNWRFSEVRLPN